MHAGEGTAGSASGGIRSKKRSEMSSELLRFVDATRESFQTGMDRHLLLGDKVQSSCFNYITNNVV